MQKERRKLWVSHPSNNALETVKNQLNAHFPLWVSPFEDVSNPMAEPVTLNIEWCLNKDCLSPHFLGAGADVKFGGSSETETTTASPTPAPGGKPGAAGPRRRELLVEQGEYPYGPAGEDLLQLDSLHDVDDENQAQLLPKVFLNAQDAYALRTIGNEYPPQSHVLFVAENVADGEKFLKETYSDPRSGYSSSVDEVEADDRERMLRQMSALSRRRGELPSLVSARPQGTGSSSSRAEAMFPDLVSRPVRGVAGAASSIDELEATDPGTPGRSSRAERSSLTSALLREEIVGGNGVGGDSRQLTTTNSSNSTGGVNKLLVRPTTSAITSGTLQLAGLPKDG